MITERILPEAEWPRLKQFFAEYLQAPLPEEGVILVSEEAGKLVGVFVLQKVWHAEPAWVASKHRGKGVLQRLLRLAYTALPSEAAGALCFTTSDRTAKLIEHFGLTRMANWQVFRWLRGEQSHG